MYKISPTCQIANLKDIYAAYFTRTTPGAFVEVGAHNGYSWSNTWGLAEAGWRGLMFEPIPQLSKACGELHSANNVKVITACVGDRIGFVDLYLNSNPTIDLETVEKSPWGETYDPDLHVLSPIVTLDYQLATENWPTKFDLLCIDVEGAELQVLRGINLWRWQPTILIVETHEMNADPRRSFHADAINMHMGALPYNKIQVDGLNTIWRRRV